MTNGTETEPTSTVFALSDQVLLAQTRELARVEQALQITVLDHLREIDARRLHLRRGYSSLFDYAVRELGYTEASAWRRIKAMRLSADTRGVHGWLQDGSLNLSNAAQLQNAFERCDRSGAGRDATGAQGAGTNPAPRGGSAPTEAATAAGAQLPVLDARARQQLVERAVGKSTRQVQQMLAEVDPESAQPTERIRALGDGRWELKVVVDGECQQGLQQLRALLSHVDPHLTMGQLVGRLVCEGVKRYDPGRPRQRQRQRARIREREAGVDGAGAGRCRRGRDFGAEAAGVRGRPQHVVGEFAWDARCRGSSHGETVLATGRLRHFGSEVVGGLGSLRRTGCHFAGEGGSGTGEPRHWRFEAGRKSRLRYCYAGEAACGGETLRFGASIYPGCREAGSVAARSGLLQLRGPAQRAALRLAVSAADRPRRAGHARRRGGAGELAPSVCTPSPLPPCAGHGRTRSGTRCGAGAAHVTATLRTRSRVGQHCWAAVLRAGRTGTCGARK